MKTTKKSAVTKAHPRKLSISGTSSCSYDQDFIRWTKDQARLLKKEEFDKLDLLNLIEEVKSLGKSDIRVLRSHLSVLLLHLLKMEYQKSKMTNSWKHSIRNALIEVELLLEDSPSLKRHLSKLVMEAYRLARVNAAEETGLPEESFSENCPWTFQELVEAASKAGHKKQ